MLPRGEFPLRVQRTHHADMDKVSRQPVADCVPLTCLMLENRWAMLGAVISSSAFADFTTSLPIQYWDQLCILIQLLRVIMDFNTHVAVT